MSGFYLTCRSEWLSLSQWDIAGLVVPEEVQETRSPLWVHNPNNDTDSLFSFLPSFSRNGPI